MEYNFEWDPAKAIANHSKHDVTFEQAAMVFKDPMAMSLFDAENSEAEEDRWVTLGMVDGQHYLVVVHTYKAQHEHSVTIRLISARRATRQEIRQYEQG